MNFAAGRGATVTESTRPLLKHELASRIVYDDQSLLSSKFKIDRIPEVYVAGCERLLRGDDFTSLFKTVRTLNENAANVEKGLYDPLISIINSIASFDVSPTEDNPNPSHWACARRRAVRSTGNMLRDDSQGYQSVPPRSPDFVIIDEDEPFDKKLWRFCDALGEVKPKTTFRPMAGSKDEQPSETTLQIADASRVHLAVKPFQLFSTTLCISGSMFYASTWDRAGGIYAPGYDICEESDWPMIIRIVLAFMRGLSSVELGEDPNVKKADSPASGKADNYPRFDIAFDGEIWTTQGRPIFNSVSFIGRGTTVWSVKNRGKGERIMKSAWRAATRTAEIEIYKGLKTSLGISDWPVGVARFDSGADVEKDGQSKVPLHVSDLRGGAGGVVPDDPILHRVILKSIGRPLWEYKEPGELLAGLRDAIIGHQQMYRHGLLHRDVSAGNVLLSRSRRVEKCYGFVSDVEFAKRFQAHRPKTPEQEDPRRVTRRETKRRKIESENRPLWVASPANTSVGSPGATMSGTPQFMARELLCLWLGLGAPSLIQLDHHDLESFIWVAIYAILRHEVVEATKALNRAKGARRAHAAGQAVDDSGDEDVAFDSAEDPDADDDPEPAATDVEFARRRRDSVVQAFTRYYGQSDLNSIRVEREFMYGWPETVGQVVPRGPLRDLVVAFLNAVVDANPQQSGSRILDPIRLTYDSVLGMLDTALQALGDAGKKWRKPAA